MAVLAEDLLRDHYETVLESSTRLKTESRELVTLAREIAARARATVAHSHAVMKKSLALDGRTPAS